MVFGGHQISVQTLAVVGLRHGPQLQPSLGVTMGSAGHSIGMAPLAAMTLGPQSGPRWFPRLQGLYKVSRSSMSHRHQFMSSQLLKGLGLRLDLRNNSDLDITLDSGDK